MSVPNENKTGAVVGGHNSDSAQLKNNTVITVAGASGDLAKKKVRSTVLPILEWSRGTGRARSMTHRLSSLPARRARQPRHSASDSRPDRACASPCALADLHSTSLC